MKIAKHFCFSRFPLHIRLFDSLGTSHRPWFLKSMLVHIRLLDIVFNIC